MTFPPPGSAGPYTGVPGTPTPAGGGGAPDLARARAAAQLVIVWLVISVVWLAVTWLYWTLAGSLRSPEDPDVSHADGPQFLFLIEAVAAVVTGVGIAALLPAVRRGVSAAQVTLASLMIGLALGHVLTVVIAAGMLLLSTIIGLVVVIGGEADTLFEVVLAAVAAIALDGALVVLAIVAAVKLFRAGSQSAQLYAPPPATQPPSGYAPPLSPPPSAGTHTGPRSQTPGVDRYGPATPEPPA